MPNGVPEKIVAETIRMNLPMPGTDYDWDAAHQAQDSRASTRRPFRCRMALTPRGFRWRARISKARNSRAGLTSAWYQLPRPDDAHPLVVVTAAGTITGDSVFNGRSEGQKVELEYARPGPDGAPHPAGRLVPYDLGPIPSWRNLRFPRSAIPSDAVAVRVVAEDLSLTPGDWVAVTPPRVPELRSVQEYVGSDQPVLMDWAVGLAFPCQQPMLHANGVTEIPKFRITPDYNAKRKDTDTWEDGLNGWLPGISDLLLRAHVMATYLSNDWVCDPGSLRKFDTVVDAQPATLDFGTATHSGLWKPGEIRIGPVATVGGSSTTPSALGLLIRPTPPTYSHVVIAAGTRLVFVAGQEPEDHDGNLVWTWRSLGAGAPGVRQCRQGASRRGTRPGSQNHDICRGRPARVPVGDRGSPRCGLRRPQTGRRPDRSGEALAARVPD